MGTPTTRTRAIICCIASFILSAAGLLADDFAYAGLGSGTFGTVDLNTGVFTLLGNLGQTPSGLGVAGGSLFAESYATNPGTLYQVNPANGDLTQIGSPSGIFISGGFGSTLTGLYALGGPDSSDLELYSIDPNTGVATAVGATGIVEGAWRDLSTNSATLYYGNGSDLYTIDTTTGLGTLVGAFGGSAQIGALVTESGVLYGGDEGNLTIDTINTTTGAATPVPGGASVSDIWGLAPDPLAPVPEPVSILLLATIAAGLTWRRHSFLQRRD